MFDFKATASPRSRRSHSIRIELNSFLTLQPSPCTIVRAVITPWRIIYAVCATQISPVSILCLRKPNEHKSHMTSIDVLYWGHALASTQLAFYCAVTSTSMCVPPPHYISCPLAPVCLMVICRWSDARTTRIMSSAMFDG